MDLLLADIGPLAADRIRAGVSQSTVTKQLAQKGMQRRGVCTSWSRYGRGRTMPLSRGRVVPPGMKPVVHGVRESPRGADGEQEPEGREQQCGHRDAPAGDWQQ